MKQNEFKTQFTSPQMLSTVFSLRNLWKIIFIFLLLFCTPTAKVASLQAPKKKKEQEPTSPELPPFNITLPGIPVCFSPSLINSKTIDTLLKIQQLIYPKTVMRLDNSVNEWILAGTDAAENLSRARELLKQLQWIQQIFAHELMAAYPPQLIRRSLRREDLYFTLMTLSEFIKIDPKVLNFGTPYGMTNRTGAVHIILNPGITRKQLAFTFVNEVSTRLIYEQNKDKFGEIIYDNWSTVWSMPYLNREGSVDLDKRDRLLAGILKGFKRIDEIYYLLFKKPTPLTVQEAIYLKNLGRDAASYSPQVNRDTVTQEGLEEVRRDPHIKILSTQKSKSGNALVTFRYDNDEAKPVDKLAALTKDLLFIRDIRKKAAREGLFYKPYTGKLEESLAETISDIDGTLPPESSPVKNPSRIKDRIFKEYCEEMTKFYGLPGKNAKKRKTQDQASEKSWNTYCL